MRVFLLVICAFLFAIPAKPMGWYDAACCNNKDCRPAAKGEIVFTPDGWYIKQFNQTLKPDEWAVKKSKDHRMHICETATRARCIYVPDPGI